MTVVGTLLRKGTVQGFAALDANGKTVVSAATDLRALMQDKLGADAADHFALVQADDSGKRFDWFTPLEGQVKPWVAATPAECSRALGQLEALKKQLTTTAQSLDATQPGQAALLRKALFFPGSDCVYLVAGKPVITFWGFAVTGGENLDPLRYLRQLPTGSLAALAGDLVPPPPPAPATEPSAEPEPAAPVVVVDPAPSPLRWLAWLLLVLVLLLALFLGLRTFAPQFKLPWGLSEIHLPWLVVQEPTPEPAVQAPESEPVVEEPKPESEPEPEKPNITLDYLNGRWLVKDAMEITTTQGSKTTKMTADYEYVFQNGQGTVRALLNNQKRDAYCRGRVVAQIHDGALEFSDGMTRCIDNDRFQTAIGKCVLGSMDEDSFTCYLVQGTAVNNIVYSRQK